mgnify:CR=1 FL=1
MKFHESGLANFVAFCDTDMGGPQTLEVLKMFPNVPTHAPQHMLNIIAHSTVSMNVLEISILFFVCNVITTPSTI